MIVNNEALNELRSNISKQYHYFKSLDSKLTEWFKVTVAMDRLDGLVRYINQIDPNRTDYTKEAFGYYDLISSAYKIMKYINVFNKYFPNANFQKSKKKLSYFSYINDEKGASDDKFIGYIRAISESDHAVNTSSNQHKPYLTGPEHSPMTNLISKNIVSVVIYDSNMSRRTLQIDIVDIYKYIQDKIDSVRLLFEEIKVVITAYYEKFKNDIIKQESEFSSYSEYIQYISIEFDKRCINDYEMNFKYLSWLFSKDINEFQEKDKVLEYKNEIEVYLTSFINDLQQMKLTEDSYKIFLMISPIAKHDILVNYHHEMGKMTNLLYFKKDVYIEMLAADLIDRMSDFIKVKYQNLDNYELLTYYNVGCYLMDK